MPAPSASRGPARRGRGREQDARATREALIAAGRELFAARPCAEVGTEEIVKRARVTRGALYHHFADKRDLFRAVHERVEEELVAGICAPRGAHARPAPPRPGAHVGAAASPAPA